MIHRGIPPVHADVPNLAPMVDVVMVILIFFMLGTTFALPEGVLPTQLPSQIGPGGGATVFIVPVVQIALLNNPVNNACQIVIPGVTLPEDSFEGLARLLKDKRVAGADPNGRILISAEPGVAYQQVISAMDACVRGGFANIQLAINPRTVVDK